MDFTFRQLRAFLLVAQYGSFSRAAGALFITRSGLSVLIRELENQLGVRLFDRTTRSVALTSAGAELLSGVQHNLQDLDSVMTRIGQAGKSDATLALGAPPLVASVLAQAIKQFRKGRPDFRIQLFDGDTSILMPMVESGRLDLGFGVFFKHLAGIRRVPMFRFSLVLISSKDRRVPLPASMKWSALKGESLIALPSSIPLQQYVDKQLARAGVTDQPRLVLNHTSTRIAMVEAGEGLAIIPSFGLATCLNRDIAITRLTNPVVHLDFHQIRRAGRKLPPIADEFTGFLRKYMGTWAERSELF